MEDATALKERIKKLQGLTVKLKLDLHDLTEELPVGWETIPDVAARCHQAYFDLAQARAELASAS
ncbi:MAG: hypothetical protein RL318_2654 [Fibrobacterota bacterium]|jgi:hypothetical protein